MAILHIKQIRGLLSRLNRQDSSDLGLHPRLRIDSNDVD